MAELGAGKMYHSCKGSVIAGLERLVESHAARDGRLSPAQVEATLIATGAKSAGAVAISSEICGTGMGLQGMGARQLGYWAGASKTSASLLTGEGLIVDMGALQDVLATALAARHAAGVSHLERLLGIDYARRGRAYVQAGMRVGYERAQAVIINSQSGVSAGRGGFANAACDGELSCDDAADVLMELMCMEERRIFAPGGCLFPFRRTRRSVDRQFDQLSREARSVEDHLDAAAGLAADALESVAAVGAVMGAASASKMQRISQPSQAVLSRIGEKSKTPQLASRHPTSAPGLDRETTTASRVLSVDMARRSLTPAITFLHQPMSAEALVAAGARFPTPTPL